MDKKICAESICPSCHKHGVYTNNEADRFWSCSNCRFYFGRDYKTDPTGKYIHLGGSSYMRKREIAKIKRLQKEGEPPVWLTRGEKEAIKNILKKEADKVSDRARLTPNYRENDPDYPWRTWYWNFMNLARAIH